MFKNFGKSLGELVEGPVRAAGGLLTLDEKEVKKGIKKTGSGVVGTATLGLVRNDEQEENQQNNEDNHRNRPRKS